MTDIVDNNLPRVEHALSNTFKTPTWYDGSFSKYKIDPNGDAGVHGLPIQLAAQCGSPEMIKFLVLHKADPKKTSFLKPKSAISIAIENCKYKNALALIEMGVKIDTLSVEDKAKLLDLSIINNDLAFAGKLLSMQIKPFIITSENIRQGAIALSVEMKSLLQRYGLQTTLSASSAMPISRLAEVLPSKVERKEPESSLKDKAAF